MPALSRIRSIVVSIAIVCIMVLVGLGSTSSLVAPDEAVPVEPAYSLLVTASSPTASPNSATSSTQAATVPDVQERSLPYRLFPSLLGPDRASFSGFHSNPVYGYGPASKEQEKARIVEAERMASYAAERQSLLAGNQVLAFYGKPDSPSMGILGEYPKEKLAPLLEAYAQLYDKANGSLGVVPAFYIIFGTCWPEGEIGILKTSVVESYISFAAERGWLVFLDHQIGKYGVKQSVQSMLPFLRHPNVHLAIDPEWRTLKPMKEIGHITGKELNEAQAIIEGYLRDNDLPGIRMLVVHQFKPTMITEPEIVNAAFDRVVLVHTSDGFGSPSLKKHSYAANARVTSMPVKGFKLFFESKVVGAGWDIPLMKPEDVLALDPMPLVVMYQ